MGGNREAVWAVVVLVLVALLVAVTRPRPEPAAAPSSTPTAVSVTAASPAPTAASVTAPSPAATRASAPSPGPTAGTLAGTPPVAPSPAGMPSPPPVPPLLRIPHSGPLTMGGVALGMTQAETERVAREVLAGRVAGETPVGTLLDAQGRVAWTEGNTVEVDGVVMLRAGDTYQQMVERLGPPSRAEGPEDGVRDYYYDAFQLKVHSFKGPSILDRFSLGTQPPLIKTPRP